MKNILPAIVMLCPMVSWSQEIKPFDAKLGLWETTVVTEIAGLPAMPVVPALPEDQLAKMPPEVRARMEAAMKGRGSGGSPRTSTSKYCLVRESLNKPIYGGAEKNCTTKLLSSTADGQKIHLECSTGGNKTVGDFTVERIDAEHSKGTMVMKSSGADSGRSVDIKMSMSNKWIAASCGDVKPLGQ